MYENMSDKDCVKLVKEKYAKLLSDQGIVEDVVISYKDMLHGDQSYYRESHWVHIREVLELLQKIEK